MQININQFSLLSIFDVGLKPLRKGIQNLISISCMLNFLKIYNKIFINQLVSRMRTRPVSSDLYTLCSYKFFGMVVRECTQKDSNYPPSTYNEENIRPMSLRPLELPLGVKYTTNFMARD